MIGSFTTGTMVVIKQSIIFISTNTTCNAVVYINNVKTPQQQMKCKALSAGLKVC